jgi:hypothetical protein
VTGRGQAVAFRPISEGPPIASFKVEQLAAQKVEVLALTLPNVGAPFSLGTGV